MQSKKWVFMFLGCLLSLPLLLMAANFIVDPFAVFGNMTWYSFSETLNPRVAKTTYLKEHWQEYDSYLVGCSSTSSYPVDALNEYLDASFYNTISYGVDMKDADGKGYTVLYNLLAIDRSESEKSLRKREAPFQQLDAVVQLDAALPGPRQIGPQLVQFFAHCAPPFHLGILPKPSRCLSQ